MKKLFILWFTVFYFAAASGTTVNMHYCMDKLVNVDFGKQDADRCNQCGSKKKADKDCCETKQEKINVDKNQQLSQYSYKIGELYAIHLPYLQPNFQHVVLSEIALGLPQGNAPPKSGQVPRYLFNCTFRI